MYNDNNNNIVLGMNWETTKPIKFILNIYMMYFIPIVLN